MATYPASGPAKRLIRVLEEESELCDDQLDAVDDRGPIAEDVTARTKEVCGAVLRLRRVAHHEEVVAVFNENVPSRLVDQVSEIN